MLDHNEILLMTVTFLLSAQEINVALKSKGASCSSTAVYTRNCDASIDGVTDKYEANQVWQLTESPSEPWLQIVFQQSYRISGITFHHTYHGNERNCKNMTIRLSDGSIQTVSFLINLGIV